MLPTMSLLLLLALMALLPAVAVAEDTVAIVVDATASPLTPTIDPNYIGFSVEVFGIHW